MTVKYYLELWSLLLSRRRLPHVDALAVVAVPFEWRKLSLIAYAGERVDRDGRDSCGAALASAVILEW